MEQKTFKEVTIVNRNYPPNKGITGVTAYELAAYLKGEFDVNINIVTTTGTYYGVSTQNEIDEETNYFKIRAIYNGKNKILRLVATFIESFLLINKIKRIGLDNVIVMTDPPFLVFWASILLNKKTWHLWSMDLFPDAFVSSNLVKFHNPLYKWIDKLTYKNAPSSIIALGSIQLQYIEDKYKKTFGTASEIIPCGIFEEEQSNQIPDWYDAEKITLGYCGNLGEAHSTEFIIQIIENIDSAQHQLVLALYGAKANVILDYLKEKSVEGVIIVDFVERKELSYLDVHLASLLSNWVNVCVPSKTISAVCSGASFLFYGIEECDNWDLLKDAGWIILENQNIEKQVKQFFSKLNHDSLLQKKILAKKIKDSLIEEKNKAMHSFGVKYLIKRAI